LPTNLETQVTHRYTANSFKLHRLPTPRPGQVLGLVGTNGIGKSTALKILAGKLKPNLGKYDVSTTSHFIVSLETEWLAHASSLSCARSQI
jgi:translation initiation factor RLI1